MGSMCVFQVVYSWVGATAADLLCPVDKSVHHKVAARRCSQKDQPANRPPDTKWSKLFVFVVVKTSKYS